MDRRFCKRNAKPVEVRLMDRRTRQPLPPSPAVTLELRLTKTGTALASSTITLTRDATDVFRWTGLFAVANMVNVPAGEGKMYVASNVESDPRFLEVEYVEALPWDG
jgi:hypothetical protein